jgi:hypothetical protein
MPELRVGEVTDQFAHKREGASQFSKELGGLGSSFYHLSKGNVSFSEIYSL